MVTFYWSWGDNNEKQYQIKATKEEGKWKISHMQGFNSYSTVAGYKKIIQDIEKGEKSS
jgi:hypothetical protein